MHNTSASDVAARAVSAASWARFARASAPSLSSATPRACGVSRVSVWGLLVRGMKGAGLGCGLCEWDEWSETVSGVECVSVMG